MDRTRNALIVLAAVLMACPSADARWFARMACQPRRAIVACQRPIRSTYAVPAVQATPQSLALPVSSEQSTDAYGFVAWLNSTRAQYGLAPVIVDGGMVAVSGQNNAHQNTRGIGHFFMGHARRQNSAMGSYASVPGMWMASPPHRDALLDPSITRVGIAGSGSYFTFSAY